MTGTMFNNLRVLSGAVHGFGAIPQVKPVEPRTGGTIIRNVVLVVILTPTHSHHVHTQDHTLH